MAQRNGTLTDVAGLSVGHRTDPEAATGCTVVLCGDGTFAGVDVRGCAPGTRETGLAVVATDAVLTKVAATKTAHDGPARAIGLGGVPAAAELPAPEVAQ